MVAMIPSLCFLFFSITTLVSHSIASKSSYIIHASNSMKPPQFSTHTEWYATMIQQVSTEPPTDHIFYHYDHLLPGFAAKLTPQQARKISKIPGIIGVYRDRLKHLHTTRTPDFIGLRSYQGLWPKTHHGDGMIVGLIDTGIWPESKSFFNHGLGPVEHSWKGECENGTQFHPNFCNDKLVGARFFVAGFEAFSGPINETTEFRSPRDAIGHGTHTCSIAAGSMVGGASLFGYAEGTAQGMASSAKIAIYKACWHGFCVDSDTLAAMEKAISDGVHVLSLSIGAKREIPYHSDPIAIGAFVAVQNGVFVACSAGNGGPTPSSIVNAAPWITTVGASTIDRSFPAIVTLGNGHVYMGSSLYEKKAINNDFVPLIYQDYCSCRDLDQDEVKGKIVVCKSATVETGAIVRKAGAAGMISTTPNRYGEATFARAFTLPALNVGYREGMEIISYIKTTQNPTANLKLEHVTLLGEARAPMVASFSSRGPNSLVPEILKPDVIAPGENVLAAWIPEPPAENGKDRNKSFNIISGTSMSCPHIAGLAAMVQEAHPTWSPAGIRSALMTTSIVLDNQFRQIALSENHEPANPLAFGAGHVYPPMAGRPGLIYDLDTNDYINFLCTLNYTEKQLLRFVKAPVSCSRLEGGPGDLNYPSFSVVFESGNGVQVLKRSLTNVAGPESYSVEVYNPRPDRVEMSVVPKKLVFTEMKEKKSYRIEFRSKVCSNISRSEMVFGYVSWESDKHAVRSPVAVAWKA